MYVVITNILAVIVVLGVMVLIHELGHFMAAKWFGVRVDVFSLGFGQRLFGFRRGETDYRVSLLPLGGYVKMAGENPSEQHSDDPREFLNKPKWQRFIIAFMGPLMNIVLAVALLTGLYMFKYEKAAYQEQPAAIGYIDKDSAAAKAGLQPGDVVTRLDGLEDPNWESVEIKVLSSPGQPLELTARRGDQVVKTTITPSTEPKNRIGVAGWWPVMPAVVKDVDKGYPADKAGIRPGDKITAVNGQPLFWPHLPEMMQESGAKPITLTIQRGGQQFNTTLTPVYAYVPSQNRQIWRMGTELKGESIERRLPFGEALGMSVETNKKFGLLIFDIVGKMLERKMSPRSLEGPIGIARLSGEAARQGLPDLVALMALISLNLGIFNLFPIPVLDGGIILLLLIEGVMRRDLSMQVKERLVQVGFVFLILIVVFAIYNDIIKALPARFIKP